MSGSVGSLEYVDDEDFFYQWVIPNFQAVRIVVDRGMAVYSSPFWYPPKKPNAPHATKPSLWQLKLYPNGDMKCQAKNAAVYIRAIPSIEERNNKIWRRGDFAYSLQISWRPFNKYQRQAPSIRRLADFRQQAAAFDHASATSRLPNCFPIDDITEDDESDLIIDLTINTPYRPEPGSKNVRLFDDGLCRFCAHPSYNRESYFNSPEFSDVQFVVEDPDNSLASQTFYAHRVILAQGSKYFAGMLSDDRWKESNNSKVAIRDVKPATFLRVLQWLYCNTFDNQVDVEFADILDLYRQADMYGLDTLVKLSVLEIRRRMNKTNWHQALLFGNENNFDIITDAAVEFAAGLGAPILLDEENMLIVFSSGDGELIRKVVKAIIQQS